MTTPPDRRATITEGDRRDGEDDLKIDPCPKCGAHLEGEWFDGGEILCVNCGVQLVATSFNDGKVWEFELVVADADEPRGPCRVVEDNGLKDRRAAWAALDVGRSRGMSVANYQAAIEAIAQSLADTREAAEARASILVRALEGLEHCRYNWARKRASRALAEYAEAGTPGQGTGTDGKGAG